MPKNGDTCLQVECPPRATGKSSKSVLSDATNLKSGVIRARSKNLEDASKARSALYRGLRNQIYRQASVKRLHGCRYSASRAPQLNAKERGNFRQVKSPPRVTGKSSKSVLINESNVKFGVTRTGSEILEDASKVGSTAYVDLRNQIYRQASAKRSHGCRYSASTAPELNVKKRCN